MSHPKPESERSNPVAGTVNQECIQRIKRVAGERGVKVAVVVREILEKWDRGEKVKEMFSNSSAKEE